MSKLYFPNLNGLRFVAASVVIIHHIEQFKEILGLPNYSKNSLVELIGKLGVTLFFVLSGFLITYLLLIEQKTKGEIKVKDFYIRRTLRIWPLYFFILILAFFIFPKILFFNIGELSNQLHHDFWTKFALYLFFLPNLVLGLYPLIPFASQSWSIGYEEQFYLVWPLLIKKIKNKNYIFLSIIGFFIIIKFLAFYVFDDYLIQKKYFKISEVFFSMPSIDCMAIGGGFAYLLFNNNKILKNIFTKNFQVVLYFIITILILSGTFIPFFNNQVYSILFGLLIINLAANPKCIINLENILLNYLGKISYGLYMYHTIIIVLVLKSLSLINVHNVILENILTFFLTIIVAAISYKYIEEKFIEKKTKF